MDPRTFWIVTALASMAVATVSVALTYYPPLTTRFWTARYRKVAGVDHVGPALELGMTYWLWCSLGFLVARVFRREAADLLSGSLLPAWGYWAVGLGAVILLLGALVVCFRLSPHEHDQMIRLDPSLIDPLPADTKDRIRTLGRELAATPGAVERESWKNRLTYIPYSVYCCNNALLLGLLALLLVAGLWHDWYAWRGAKAELARLMPLQPPAAGVPLAEGFSAEAQLFLSHFISYQDQLLAYARNLLAGVAAMLIPFIWFLGTSYQTIYTAKVVAAMRIFARCVVVILVILTAFCYFDLAATADRVNTQMRKITESRQPATLALEDLEELNDFRITISNEATVDDFWARLINSYGGVFFIVATVISILRKRRMGTSFMGLLIPRPLRLRNNAFLRAVVAMPQEPAAGAASAGAAGARSSSEEPR